MIVDIVQTVIYLGVAGYAAHRVENAMLARNGYDTRDFFKRRKELPPQSKPTVAGEFERYALQADHEERQKLLASPTGWLLDPFRYPTNPHEGREIPAWRGAIDARMELKSRMARADMGLEPMYVGPDMLRPEATFRTVMTDPACPACGSEHTEASATHGRTTSMWWCRECTAEFTRDGETKKSKKARKSLPPLPCGCTGAIEVDFILNGVRESECLTCHSVWEPRSNDKTGRTLGQGERVRWSASKRRSGFGPQDEPFDLPPPPNMR